jgi:hypothetical protein
MKLTIKGHVYAQQESWHPKPIFTFFDFAADGWVPICAHEVVVDIPDDFDIRPAKIIQLEQEKEKLRAAFTARITEINGEIQSLLAIENKPSKTYVEPGTEDIPF